MEQNRRKNVKWVDHDGFSHSLTYVRANQTRIDEKGLRKALTAKVFDKYTKRVLDRPKMEKAMDTGDLDPVTVAKFVSTQPGKPYLKYTLAEEKAEE